MSIRRLLLGAGTGFVIPPPTPFALGATGFWNAMSSPRAAYYNGRTYLGWTTDAGDVYAAHWDHATATLSTPVLLVAGQVAVDGAIHVSPAILVRASDHRIVVANVANGGTHKPGIWISTNPEDASAFGAGADIGTAGVYTYTDLVALGSDIYLIVAHWSGGERRMAWYVSSDGGSTWGSMVVVMRPAVNSTFFWRVLGNGSRIDMFTTDTDRSAADSSIYHAYWDGTTLRNSAGTSLGALAAFSADGTLVQDDSLGSAYMQNATWDGANLVGALWIDLGSQARIRRATYTGGSWVLSTVTDNGGEVGGNPNVAGCAVAWGDGDTFYVPIKVGSFFELYRYTYSGSWSGTALTSGSASDAAAPEAPQDADPALAVLFGRGSYTDDADFDFAIYGVPS